MKILELINEEDAFQTQRKVIKGSRSEPIVNMMKSGEYNKRVIGSGADAVVFNTNDPHTVLKMQKFDRSKTNARRPDAFSAFVDWLMKTPEAKNNIHFPRVYKYKTHIASNGERVSTYEIERLHGVEELSDMQLESVLQYLYGDNWRQIVFHGVENGYFRPMHEITAPEAISLSDFEEDEQTYMIATLLDPFGSRRKNMVAEEYIKAADLLKMYINSDSSVGSADLHIGNIMYRLGAHIPIPIFNDPMF